MCVQAYKAARGQALPAEAVLLWGAPRGLGSRIGRFRDRSTRGTKEAAGVNLGPDKSLHAAGAPEIAGYRRWPACLTLAGKGQWKSMTGGLRRFGSWQAEAARAMRGRRPWRKKILIVVTIVAAARAYIKRHATRVITVTIV